MTKEYDLLKKKGIQDLHNNELIMACKYNSDLLGELLLRNRDFIFSMIMHFKGNIEALRIKFRISEEELFQHACIGVMSALKEFDFTRGIKFTTFVARPMMWEINQLLYSGSQPVRLSRGAVEVIRQMVEIEDELGYRPKEDEMSELLGITVDRYREIALFSDDLDHYDSDETFEIEDKSSETSLEEDIINSVYIMNLVEDSMFTEMERTIMKMILEEESNKKIASSLGVYPMTINRALNKIRIKIKESDSDNKSRKQRPSSKYEDEIKIICAETRERGAEMPVEDILELLEVCGFDSSSYSTRILYYMRQKASVMIHKKEVKENATANC